MFAIITPQKIACLNSNLPRLYTLMFVTDCVVFTCSFSDQDFSSVTHDLTFPPTDSAQTEPAFVTISLTNDEINEGAEVFVVMLELVDAVYASHVDLSVRNVSLCRIGDNDRKQAYTIRPVKYELRIYFPAANF